MKKTGLPKKPFPKKITPSQIEKKALSFIQRECEDDQDEQDEIIDFDSDDLSEDEKRERAPPLTSYQDEDALLWEIPDTTIQQESSSSVNPLESRSEEFESRIKDAKKSGTIHAKTFLDDLFRFFVNHVITTENQNTVYEEVISTTQRNDQKSIIPTLLFPGKKTYVSSMFSVTIGMPGCPLTPGLDDLNIWKSVIADDRVRKFVADTLSVFSATGVDILDIIKPSTDKKLTKQEMEDCLSSIHCGKTGFYFKPEQGQKANRFHLQGYFMVRHEATMPMNLNLTGIRNRYKSLGYVDPSDTTSCSVYLRVSKSGDNKSNTRLEAYAAKKATPGSKDDYEKTGAPFNPTPVGTKRPRQE